MTCTVAECTNAVKIKSRGWCLAHYRRWQRYGDPTYGQTTMRVLGSTPFDRLRAHTIVGDDDECWPCTVESRLPSGHRYLKVDGKKVGAHVIAYTHHYGPLPAGHEVRHSCDNPPCCNPQHLLSGTRQDNVNDMIERKRNLVGEDHPNARLTSEQVAAIREATGRQADIAAEYGVSESYVSMLRNRKRRKHDA